MDKKIFKSESEYESDNFLKQKLKYNKYNSLYSTVHFVVHTSNPGKEKKS